MPDNREPEFLIALTTDIVSAHVSHNPVASDTLPGLIQSVHGALAGLGQPVKLVAVPLEPAVSIRASVKPDSIACLECGKKMKMLKRHLSTDHDLSVEEYRARWKLPADYPLIAPNYAQKRRELAKSLGLGRKPAQKRGRKAARAG
ncbi:MAG: MucR family transcriptional regulator [Candidatus Andeanibacterium colombiense]|uniref:MucR family transcriptional regulator n=1 Tax=Candidatus Andeanibacterium colombiense TaxID=3121345 RepID=A0AAJ5XB29_9SPHN|nr:MAG: MucR family transcriptional regulator [Sphingomonadaceae bacterium]